MIKTLWTGLLCLMISATGFAQVRDTLPDQDLFSDTAIDYDELLNDLDAFLDSILNPRSYFLANVSAGSGYFNYARGNSLKVDTKKSIALSPTIGYYHKSGPGLTLSGNMADGQKGLTLYQYVLTPSFDFNQNFNWVAGVSYSRYFNRDSLPFYISPLQNEVSAYFTWRKPWLQPGITASYGWGSREEFQKRERFIRILRLRRLIVTSDRSEEVSDFFVAASVRHSFYWMRLGGEKNYLKFTPQLAFSAGSQKFGFNHTTSAFVNNNRRDFSMVYNNGDVSMDEKTKFQPLSMTLYLRPEYNLGRFFVQPQFILDYYMPAEDLSALFSLNAGVIL